MPDFNQAATALIERRLLRWLLLMHCLFIVYGSFIPFEFHTDPGFVHYQWAWFFKVFDGGARRFSGTDIFSNVLLFIPFGVLWVGGVLPQSWRHRFATAVAATGAVGFFFGLTLEAGQLLAVRDASFLDAVSNGIGSLFGAAAGCLLFRAYHGSVGAQFVQLVRERPSLIFAAFLILAPLATSYYPFEVTLDVSTIAKSVHRIRWALAAERLQRFWLELLVEKVLLFAAVSYLVLRSLAPAREWSRRGGVWLVCAGIAALIEIGKLFFAGRAPNFGTALLESAGALCGLLLIPPLTAISPVRRHGRLIVTGLVVLVVTYSELWPFEWNASREHILFRISRIEWLPFVGYYYSDPHDALFDLGKKLFLLAPLGFLVAAGTERYAPCAAALAGLSIGVILETAQIALPSRSPSLTDVLIFTFGAWAGAVIYDRYLQLTSGYGARKIALTRGAPMDIRPLPLSEDP